MHYAYQYHISELGILNRVVVPVEMRSFNKLMQFYSKREILSKDKTLFLFVSLSNLDKIVHSIKIEAFAAVKAQSRHQQLVSNFIQTQLTKLKSLPSYNVSNSWRETI